jgi:hypothetical protein
MSFRGKLSTFLTNVQLKLIPDLEDRIGVLKEEHKKIITILELVRIEDFIPCTRFNFGRPIKHRIQIARAFIAKIILKITYTKELKTRLERDPQLRTICGWDYHSTIPSESKFSRAFAEFAERRLPERVHQALISDAYNGKIVGHVVKDSTPIVGRERALKKEGSMKERRKLLNKQQAKEKRKGNSRKQRQLKQDLNTMVRELPACCDIGAKKMANGFLTSWKGYKLHVAIDDHCIPLAAIVTSASLNDSEVAIPLAIKSNLVARNFYDLMDSAYNSPEIKEHSFLLGHVPIIDKRPRSTVQKEEKKAEQKRKMLLNAFTAEDRRYKERMPKERFNALFKDYYGGNNIWYRGCSKISCHLMFGLLTLTANTLLRLSSS